MTSARWLDDRVLLGINAFARSSVGLHAPLLAYARYGVVLFGVLLLLGLVRSRSAPARSLAAASWACVAVLLALALNQPLGRLVGEARPYDTHPGLFVLASRTADFSFPSDHAVMSGAAAAGLLLVSRRLGLVATAAALLMAFDRVYIGAHYPWDVLAGLVLGAAVSLLGWRVLARPLTRFAAWLRRRPPLRAVFAPAADPAGTPALAAPRSAGRA